MIIRSTVDRVSPGRRRNVSRNVDGGQSLAPFLPAKKLDQQGISYPCGPQPKRDSVCVCMLQDQLSRDERSEEFLSTKNRTQKQNKN